MLLTEFTEKTLLYLRDNHQGFLKVGICIENETFLNYAFV